MTGALGSAADALLAMAARGGTQLFVMAVTLVATRFLSPSDFGVFALATVFITFVRTLLYAGPAEYLLKTPAPDRDAADCLAAMMLTALLASAAVAGLAAGLFAVSGAADVAWLMLILAPSNLIAALTSWSEALLLRGHRLRAFYGAAVVTELASAVAAITLLLAGWQLGALVVQVYLRMTLPLITSALLLSRPRLRRPETAGVMRLLHWSASRYGAAGVAAVSTYSGDLILGVLLSPAATGLFRASNRVATAASDMFAHPAGLLVRTALARRHARGDDVDGGWLAMFAGIAMIGWAALVDLALVADWIAAGVLGPGWASAAAPIAILCLARLFAMLGTAATAMLVTHDRQTCVFRAQLVAAGAVATATVVLSPWGVNGAAVALLGASAGTALWLTCAALQLGGEATGAVRRSLGLIASPLLASALATLIGRWLAIGLTDTPIQQIMVSGLCGGVGWAIGIVPVRARAREALIHLTRPPPPQAKTGVPVGGTATG